VVPGLEHPQQVGVRQYGRNRIEAARQRLADHRQVRLDPIVFFGQQLARAPKPGLDLVGHEGDIPLGADAPHVAKIALGRHDDAGLTLDGLDHECNGVRGDGILERLRIAERDDLESGCERAESIAVLSFRAEADDGHGPAVEVVFADDDLRLALGHALSLVTPFACCLDACLNGLGAAVHRQDDVGVGQLAELLVEEP